MSHGRNTRAAASLLPFCNRQRDRAAKQAQTAPGSPRGQGSEVRGQLCRRSRSNQHRWLSGAAGPKQSFHHPSKENPELRYSGNGLRRVSAPGTQLWRRSFLVFTEEWSVRTRAAVRADGSRVLTCRANQRPTFAADFPSDWTCIGPIAPSAAPTAQPRNLICAAVASGAAFTPSKRHRDASNPPRSRSGAWRRAG